MPDGPGKKSDQIGAARSRMPIPAVTLKHSTTHSSQNCGVRMALRAETSKAPASTPSVGGVQPRGRQPGGGTRISSQPTAMNTA